MDNKYKLSDLDPTEYDANNQPESSERRTKRWHKAVAGVGMFAACVATSNQIIKELQVEAPPAIVSIDTNPSAKDWIVTFSGFASANYSSKPDDLACTVDTFDDRNVLAVQHRGEFNLEKISDLLADEYNRKNMQSLTLHGESAGGLMAIKVGAMLIKKGVNVTEIHMVTSPVTLDDVRIANKHKRFVKIADVAMRAPIIDGYFELGTNIGSEFLARDNNDSATTKLSIAKNRTLSLPTNVLKGEVQLLKDGVEKEDIEVLAKHNVNIIYMAPHADDQDSLVNTATAYQSLSDVVGDVVGHDWVKYYLKRVRLGQKHAPTTHSENEIINAVWVSYTNAQTVNSPTAIEVIGGLYPDCEETYRDVLFTLENGDYS